MSFFPLLFLHMGGRGACIYANAILTSRLKNSRCSTIFEQRRLNESYSRKIFFNLKCLHLYIKQGINSNFHLVCRVNVPTFSVCNTIDTINFEG